jgi:YhcN/YlaJ family sporulation lipoprotein
MISVNKRIAVIMVLLFALSGCHTANKPAANAPPTGKKISYTERVNQTAPQPKYNRSAQAVANRMVDLATKVPQVRGATAISIGKYTVVGINVDPTLDRGRVGTIKYTVAQALQKDPQGSRAIVTADPDVIQRIRELNEDIKQGRPLAGISNELADIVARLSPQPSREVKKREEPNSKLNQERINQSPKPLPTRME